MNETPEMNSTHLETADSGETKNSRICPKCGAAIENPNAIICVNCGTHLASGVSIQTKRVVEKGSRILFALTAGAGIAVVFGILWGVMGIFLGVEHSWIALLAGLAVGGGMSYVAKKQSRALGVAAVILTIGALLLGKIFLMEHQLHYQASPLRNMLQAYDSTITLLENPEQPQQETAIFRLMLKQIETEELPEPWQELYDLPEEAPAPKFRAAIKAGAKLEEQNLQTARALWNRKTETEQRKFWQDEAQSVLMPYVYDELESSERLPHEIDWSELEKAETASPAQRNEFLARIQSALEENCAYAEEQLAALSEADLQAQYRKVIAETKQEKSGTEQELRSSIFRGLFDHYDILFALAAMVSAWAMATPKKGER